MRTRVARLYGAHDLRVEEQEIPPPGPGEVMLRMAAGGHFLSDVIFAALFTAMIVLAGARVFRLPVDAQRP